jgi:sugar/nucleoside kinase (ribokinase family)
MLDLLAIGDIKRDTFVVVKNANVMCGLNHESCKMCIDYGKKIPVDHFTTQIAGSAPNVAVGLARLGYRTAVLATVGQDEIGKVAKKFLKKEHVSPRYVKMISGQTSSQSIVLNVAGESTQLTAHATLHSEMPKRFPKTRAVHVGELGKNDHEVFQDIIKRKKTEDIFLSINPGRIQIHERKKYTLDALFAADMLTINLGEAQTILGTSENDPTKLLPRLRDFCPNIRIITHAEHGAWAQQGDHAIMHIAAQKAQLVEATGAGDAFVSGVLAVLLAKNTNVHNIPSKKLQDALHFGNAESASVIGHVGPTSGLLHRISL